MFDALGSVIQKMLSAEVLVSMALVVFLLIGFLVMRTFFTRFVKRAKESGQYAEQRVRMARNIYTFCRYALLIIVVMAILGVNGIDITALAAAAGAASIIVAFALQDILNDVAMGIRIVTDNFFHVGDVIKIESIEGEVLSITPQSTKVRSILDNSTHTFSNRLLKEVTVLDPMVDLDIPLSYDLTGREAQELMEEIVTRVNALPDVDRAEFKGTQAFEDSDIMYRMRLWCDPRVRYQALRDARRIAQDVLEEFDQSIPYPQMDLHIAQSSAQ